MIFSIWWVICQIPAWHCTSTEKCKTWIQSTRSNEKQSAYGTRTSCREVLKTLFLVLKIGLLSTNRPTAGSTSIGFLRIFTPSASAKIKEKSKLSEDVLSDSIIPHIRILHLHASYATFFRVEWSAKIAKFFGLRKVRFWILWKIVYEASACPKYADRSLRL